MFKVGEPFLRHIFKKTQIRSYPTRTCASNYFYTTQAKDSQYEDYKIGSQYKGYKIIQELDIPEFFAKATLLEHLKTGAEHLHIHRDDQNNVFSVGFRTTPLDSTGVSHILEHSVLCGSKRYPCRDPFFKMLNRSLSTFMNAMTASDWTLYPFSTQNPKDYMNLMSVYLDAAFHPILSESDFRQEGWRLENSNVHDIHSDIVFKGVVFNEMKGALSSPESVYYTKHQTLLLPHHTYGYVSGGDPLHIPNLTWKQLKDFHTTHYHPSNARFYTYGNFPLTSTLEMIDRTVLNHYDEIDPGTEIPNEPKWNEPRFETITCPRDPLAADVDKQTTVSTSYMLPVIDDPFELFAIGILSSLLVAGPNSPFYQALIEPNIGSDYSPVIGIDTSSRNPTFTIGLQGLHESNVERVIRTIDETLANIQVEGFDKQRIESILHRTEMGLKHQSSNFGLRLLMTLYPYWNQDKDPLSLLKFNEQIEKLYQTLEVNPDFFKEKVQEYLINNTHKLVLVMKAEDDYNAKLEAQEMELLQQKVQNLSDEDKRQIQLDGVKLENLQNSVDDLSVLPKMHLEDVEPFVKETTVKTHLADNVNVYMFEQPTNGITYFRCIATTSSIPYILQPYLPLFTNVICRLGAAGKTYKELAQLIELTTGGVSASTHLITDHTNIDSFEKGIMLSSHCLERNIPMKFSIWQDILNEPSFDNPERLQTLINAYASELNASISHNGHMYAMATASKFLTPAAQVGELFSGLSQVEFMKEIAGSGRIEDVIESLMKIATYMLNANEMRCSLNATETSMLSSLVGVKGMLSSLNVVGFDDSMLIEDSDFTPKIRKTFIEMDFPVHYVSRCIRTVPYTHEHHAVLQILAKLLSAKYLHREIREKGGAYGSGASISSGIFAFYSYRDPNNIKTLDVFSNSVDWACNGKFTDEDIEEAKLSVFSSIDSPISPSNKGMVLFQNHLTDELRQEHRDRFFSTNRHKLIEVANQYLANDLQIYGEAIIGPKLDASIDSDSWKISSKIHLS